MICLFLDSLLIHTFQVNFYFHCKRFGILFTILSFEGVYGIFYGSHQGLLSYLLILHFLLSFLSVCEAAQEISNFDQLNELF